MVEAPMRPSWPVRFATKRRRFGGWRRSFAGAHVPVEHPTPNALAAERRQTVAQGVSHGGVGRKRDRLAPKGRQKRGSTFLSPLRGLRIVSQIAPQGSHPRCYTQVAADRGIFAPVRAFESSPAIHR